MYLDFTFCFFFISMALLELNATTDPSRFLNLKTVRTTRARHILPFLLNLNLKPLYSNLGGSTTRAEPLIKSPTVEWLRLNPLYRWKVLSHRTLVLSEIEIQVSRLIKFNLYLIVLFLNSNPSTRWHRLLFNIILVSNKVSRSSLI